MDFIKDYIEQHWSNFISYLESMGIPKEECEDYANELIEKLNVRE